MALNLASPPGVEMSFLEKENLAVNADQHVATDKNVSVKVNSRAIFNFGGQNKVVFRYHKDSDDEFSVGSRTPFTPKSTHRSPLRELIYSPPMATGIFESSNKTPVPDSDDERSTSGTPIRSNVCTPARTEVDNLDPISEEEAPSKCPYEADIDRLSNGIVARKVCGGNIQNKHKRALFVDPTHTFLYWTDKKHAGADEVKKAKLARGISRSKSWFKKNDQVLANPKTRRMILISKITEISLGTGEFSHHVQIKTKPECGQKLLIFSFDNESTMNCFLNAATGLSKQASR